jgi:hypothetical protein
MSSSFTFLNALPIIMVATKKTSKPWEPSPYYFCPAPAMEAFLSVRRQLAPGGPTVAGYPRESTPGRVPWSRARIPAQEALERHTGDPLLDALVQASTGHNAARRPPRPGWSASELRPAPSCTSASAVAAAGPSDGRQSLPSACCRGRARDSCRGAECSGEPGAAWVTKWRSLPTLSRTVLWWGCA